MLTQEEAKLVKTYYTLSFISVLCIPGIFALAGVWLVMCMLGDLVFHGQGLWIAGMVIWLVLTFVLVVLACYGRLRVVFGMRKDAWKAIVQKAQVAQSDKTYRAELFGGIGTAAAGRMMQQSDNPDVAGAGQVAEVVGDAVAMGAFAAGSAVMGNNAKSVARAFGIQLPKLWKFALLVIVLPLIVLVIAYIPSFVSSSNITQASQERAAQPVYDLEKAFEEGCASVIANDPLADGYDERGYTVYGNLYEYEDERDSHISVTVGNDGLVHEVTYSLSFDYDESLAANLKQAKADFAKLHEMLAACDVEYVSNKIADFDAIPAKFEKAFLAGSPYEGVGVTMSDDRDEGGAFNRVSFLTYAEEDITEYSDPCIHISLEGTVEGLR